MKLLVNVLLVAGFCIGTVGAAGFHEPVDPEERAERPDASTERLAWPLFAAGMGLVLAGGALSRVHRKARIEGGAGGEGLVARSHRLLGTIRDRVAEMDEVKDTLGEEEMRDRIDHLLGGEMFDLTSENEELAAALGFDAYARVWEGVATAERLLARTWSFSTDGHHVEGLVELPRARAELERSAREMDAVVGV